MIFQARQEQVIGVDVLDSGITVNIRAGDERPDDSWWDVVLNGQPHELDVRQLPGFDQELRLLRSAMYRQAYRRLLTVQSHQLDRYRMRVWAYGHLGEKPLPVAQSTALGLPNVRHPRSTSEQ